MDTDAPNRTNTGQRLMPTHIDSHVITLQQWLSPAFPVGSFAYSHGMEWAIETGKIKTETELYEWILDLLQFGSVRSDAILVALACKSDHPRELNKLALALCPARERVDEMRLQGTAFCAVLRDVWGQELNDLVLPVALGHAARVIGMSEGMCVSGFLHAFCSNLISVAVRLVPLGQTEGQRVLHRLTLIICDLSRSAVLATEDDLTSHSFLSDVAAMRHETMRPRIFKT